MKLFRDMENREWKLSLDVSSIKRVRSLLNVDLLKIVEKDSELLAKIIDDPCLVVDIIYVVCKPQADAAGVTDEQFGQAMAGDVIDDASGKLLEELSDFFPDARMRAILKKIVSKTKLVAAKILTTAETKLDEWDPDAAAVVIFERLEKSGSISIDSPESSESTPAPSPSPS